MTVTSSIICPGCAQSSPVGKRFCADCGSALPQPCPACGAPTIPGKRFCADCGTPIDTQAPDLHTEPAEAAHPAPTPRRHEAERRRLTVLFCDLVGSTALSERLDPEDLRDVIRAYQEAAASAIETFGGHIAQYLGDGLLVYFGYPAAHEDDAARAVRTGLAIVDAVAGLSRTFQALYGMPIDVRIGIHSGLVVVGEMGGGGRHERLAVGDTPNIAARLQSLAEPGHVVLCTPTYRLVEGLFSCRDIGTHALKGIAEPVSVFAVLAESGTASRLEAATSSRIGPMVGREDEVTTILARWRRAEQGNGQVILLDAEPGIGKSRLVRAIKDRLADVEHVRDECRCSPYAQNTTLYPIIELLQRIFGFEPSDTALLKWAKIESSLAGFVTLPAIAAELFAELLSIPPPLDNTPSAVGNRLAGDPPKRRRELLLDSLLAWLVEAADHAPQLFVVEDLHWADPSTLELMDRVIHRIASSRILCVFTFRPEFVPPWKNYSHISHITLTQLDSQHAEAVALRIADGRALPDPVMRQIIAKTDGVPLFVEELTKTVIESGQLKVVNSLKPAGRAHFELVGDVLDLEIPSTLQGSLMARLDRLGPTKEIAQLASVLGREFPFELLLTVAPFDDIALERELERLVHAELLFRHGDGRHGTYSFKHALIGDTAYQSLLKSTRQRYHLSIARALREQFPDVAAVQPELLAHHFGEGHDYDSAIRYWQTAGKRAMDRSAVQEAIAHFLHALELLPRIEGDRASIELPLQLGYGMALMSHHGFTAHGVDQAFQRAFNICSDIGDVPELFPALYGLWMYDFVGARCDSALSRCDQLLAIAERTHDPIALLEAKYVTALTLSNVGAPVRAHILLKEALALYDPALHRTLPGASVPAASCRAYLGLTHFVLGRPDTARALANQAVEIAEAANHPYTLGYTYCVASLLFQLMGDHEAAVAAGERAVSVSAASNLTFWHNFASVVLAGECEPSERLERLPVALQTYYNGGAALYQTVFLLRLAEAHSALGNVDEALGVLDRALTLADSTNERFVQAELIRLKGDTLLAQSPDHEADAMTCLTAALKIARKQGVRAFELRAATSIACLLESQGRRSEARVLLSSVYDLFAEGFDTRDLRAAHTLLQSLSNSM